MYVKSATHYFICYHPVAVGTVGWINKNIKFRGLITMSEKLLLIIACIFCCVLAVSPMFIELPFIVLLILACVPVVAAFAFIGTAKK